jgi:hypothetical protein
MIVGSDPYRSSVVYATIQGGGPTADIHHDHERDS